MFLNFQEKGITSAEFLSILFVFIEFYSTVKITPQITKEK